MKKKDKKKNNKPKVGLWKCTKVFVPQIIKAHPLFFTIGCVIVVIQSLLSSAQVYLLEGVFDNAAGLLTGDGTTRAMIIFLSVYVGAVVFAQLIGMIANYVDTVHRQKTENAMNFTIKRKLARIKPILFEDTDVLDDIEKGKQGIGAGQQYLSMLKNLVLYQLPYFAVVSSYMVTREPLLLLTMVISFFPTVIQQFAIKKLYGEKEDKIAPLRRKQGYYGECINKQENFKETRMLGAYGFFIKGYNAMLKKILKIDLATGVKTEGLYTLTSVFSLAGRIGTLYLLFWLTMKGRISIGEFAAMYAVIDQINNMLHNLFYNTFSNMSKQLPLMENYVRMMNFPEDEGIAVELPEKCSISLHNVTFRYPNQEKNALDGVSFDVAPGETVAIVGENGSGKSTLMRLLTGMYKPDEGEVMYGRYSTKEINMSSVARNYSAVFQNYAHYAISLRENLIVGDTDAVPEEGKMTLACRRGGFEPTEEWLPSGLDTILDRQFDGGVGLSGGQVQRIAVARAFYREAGSMILDEPTAAIDPIEEARIYNRFATLAKDKTAFIVTHRLGSVRLADRIIVMKDGRVAETGTHESLMKKNGEYRRMFDSQSSWYKEA